jgi:hypothetical protein
LASDASASVKAWQPRAYEPVEAKEPEAITPSGPAAADATDVSGRKIGAFIIDALVDVAAAGPATATERGVVMVNRSNQVQLARLTAPLDSAAAPRDTPVAVLRDGAGPFPLARGPAVRRSMAYWVSRGQLLRQAANAPGGSAAPQVLTEDARVGTRVAVPVGLSAHVQALPEVAAYIARPKDPDAPLTAKLWVEGQPQPLGLTDDTSSALSVALAGTATGLAVMFLEARTGMSSIHLRLVDFSKSPPSLGEDRVVWVGGPSRPSTELQASGADAVSVGGLLTLERDMTHFGLAELRIPLSANALPLEPNWSLYANGIEPAPFAAATVCGRSVVALARPSSALPHAPQELVLTDLVPDGTSEVVLLARSSGFFDVSLARVGRGALLSYVADHRTWARSIRCSS